MDNLGHSLEKANLNGTKNGEIPRSYLNRKQSSPMMPAFMVSAPGKVIVFGEHSVVHQKVLHLRALNSH